MENTKENSTLSLPGVSFGKENPNGAEVRIPSPIPIQAKLNGCVRVMFLLKFAFSEDFCVVKLCDILKPASTRLQTSFFAGGLVVR